MGGFCPGGFCPGGFCPRGDFVQGDFVRGILSVGFCPGGFCPRTVNNTGGVVSLRQFLLNTLSLLKARLSILAEKIVKSTGRR